MHVRRNYMNISQIQNYPSPAAEVIRQNLFPYSFQ